MEENLFGGCRFPLTVRAYVWVTSETSREQWHQACLEGPREGCQKKVSGLNAEGGLSLDAVPGFPRQIRRKKDKEAARRSGDPPMSLYPSLGHVQKGNSQGEAGADAPARYWETFNIYFHKENGNHATHLSTQLFPKCFVFKSFLYYSIWISERDKDFRGREGSFQGIYRKDFTIGLFKGKFFRKDTVWSWPPV